MKENDEKKVQNQEEVLNQKSVQSEANELLNDSEAEILEGGDKKDQDELSEWCAICQSNLV